MRNKKKLIIYYGTGLGAGLFFGYLYYHYVGCLQGTCPITSSVLGSMLLGGVIGVLIAGIFADSGAARK